MNRVLLVAVVLFGWLAPVARSGAETNLVFAPEYLSEIMRHLYRWHLDETALLNVDETPEVELWVREVTPELDAEDQSRYCEMLVPQLSFLLLLKQADYEVPEMGLRIENSGFRVLRTERYESLPSPRESYQILRVPKRALMEYLFATRNKSEYPDAELRERMRKALRGHMGGVVSGPQTFYVAPLSPVANDLWVFWESGGKLIRFSSDTDFTSKAYWEYEKLGINIYDLKENVVVSLAETLGSNAYVTRDWAARALFNCVVFGQRLVIVPEADLAKPLNATETPVR